MFRKFRIYEFRKVSKIFFSQFYVCFARLARFRRDEFRKVSQFSVSQEFANGYFFSQVSQGFRNGRFADDSLRLRLAAEACFADK